MTASHKNLYLGIDPGSALIGFGLVTMQGSVLIPVAYGTIVAEHRDEAMNLAHVYGELSVLLKKYPPTAAAVERLFFMNNQKTAMAVSQSRGAILLALAHHGIPIHSPTPIQVKQYVTGYGKAGKPQVQEMVKTILRIQERIRPDDAADALALAICAALMSPTPRARTS